MIQNTFVVFGRGRRLGDHNVRGREGLSSGYDGCAPVLCQFGEKGYARVGPGEVVVCKKSLEDWTGSGEELCGTAGGELGLQVHS